MLLLPFSCRFHSKLCDPTNIIATLGYGPGASVLETTAPASM